MKKLFIFFIFTSLSAALFAAERILRFDVVLTLDENSKATVEETITVNAEHNKIRRGIYRDIPQSIFRQVKPYSLQMDGKPHPFFTEKNGGDLRINFGDNNYIPRGEHTYRFIYTMENAAILHKDIDEVYWNITGNYWVFPIERASFHLILPDKAEVINEQISLYTGFYGQKEQNAQSTGWLRFETTRPLRPQEGFTVAVPFKKGAVKMSYSFLKNLKIPFLIILFTYLYYFFAWLKAGVDPKDNVPPLYKPPQGISPAMMRYILLRTSDNTSFSSALISLAMKGYITIEEMKGSIGGKRVDITVKHRNAENLPNDEDFLLNHILLFKHFIIEQSNSTAIQNALSSFSTLIQTEGQKKYVNKNFIYLLPPIIVMGLIFLFCLIHTKDAFILLHYTVFVLAFCLFTRKIIYRALIFMIFTALYSPFFLMLMNGYDIYFYLSVSYILIVFGFIFFSALIDNVTAQGREAYLQSKGFSKYMQKAEKYRTQASNPLEKEKVFCDYLPYAYALGIQSKWINSFKDIISQSAIEKHLSSCGGMNFISKNILCSTIRSTSISRSSGRSGFGRGSGGGGFSGGGCGGGGGGGR